MFDFKNAEDFKEKCGYEIDSRWYPRVTQIIGIKAKPALYYYYGEAPSYKAAQEMTQKSAEEGTLVHEIVQKIMVGDAVEIPESIRPAVVAYQQFIETKNIQVDREYVEKRIWHPTQRYAGTIDGLALIDGKFGVLDIKTSQAVYRDYNLQTSAYMEALRPELPSLETRWILRIDQIHTCLACGATMRPKGGRNKIRRGRKTPCAEHSWSDLTGVVELKEFPFWKDDFEAFLGAKKLWEWEHGHWLKNIGYF
ncbi:MAG: hypothetical protein A3H63_00135 [Candidatus Harrisonbacteria bacterium RIFCSPLOWO2_02_FULL_45_10c]|uniref:PD-(D/E)XK endonuclease-like domain-containing protein n=1 Tax=Candidatus Harrisonbacteria bacterium RIFCSPLOWO2_02_FULL_45_10c TaxID=1798410 RepID=A0A1G1ZTR1_9BACT|nr:MAG: hypothetical protein A3H63_00135 [Candidatus Harrisonbacteria bacterium RIFCSPLOWO2_02_FULL_45_10c]